MTRYYWYIDADPRTHMGYDISSHVKRALNPPSKKYYYVTETVDGYTHVIKGKNGEKLSMMNDNGNPVMIKNLFSSITEILKNKFVMDREEITEETSVKKRSTSMWDQDSLITIDDAMLLESARRRKRIKSRMNIRPPQYRRKTKKR